MSWKNAILENDQAHFTSKWEELITQKKTVTIESRMQTPWEGDIGGSLIKTQRWILTSIFPEVDEIGTLRSVMGCMFVPGDILEYMDVDLALGITDISSIKWAEDLQNRRLREAEETRRAQNNFIDITSHEMRNPLSAIIQCADVITSSLNALESQPRTNHQELADAITESITSAETIQLCAQHQQHIVGMYFGNHQQMTVLTYDKMTFSRFLNWIRTSSLSLLYPWSQHSLSSKHFKCSVLSVKRRTRLN